MASMASSAAARSSAVAAAVSLAYGAARFTAASIAVTCAPSQAASSMEAHGGRVELLHERAAPCDPPPLNPVQANALTEPHATRASWH